MKSALYITYDGLSDQLGGSQIIPYIKYLARKGHKITVISCEKKKNLTEQIRKDIHDDLASVGISWDYVFYTKSPPILSGLYDRWKLKQLATKLFRQTHFDIVHCRSYLPALVGLSLKNKFSNTSLPTPKFVFDMRGFWADEKVEVGSWPQTNFIYSTVYNYFKKAEASLIKTSDHIVILTHAGADELQTWPQYKDLKNKSPITVIPCCVDTDHFEVVTPEVRAAAKRAIDFTADDEVLGYLGAIGGWYMLDEMLTFFSALKAQNPKAKMLFITRSDPALILDALPKHNISKGDVLIKPAKRHEVPGFLAAMDLGLSFIKPTYAKTASSPTKQAEYLSCGIPIITNDKIGDNLTLIGPIEGCEVLPDLEEETLNSFAKAVNLAPLKGNKEAQIRRAKNIREQSVALFSLNVGGERYNKIYESL